MIVWAWHQQYGCHAHFTKGSAAFKHVTKIPTKNQNFSKIVFACFHMKSEASKSYIKHFPICDTKGSEKFSCYLPVHLFQVSLIKERMPFLVTMFGMVSCSAMIWIMVSHFFEQISLFIYVSTQCDNHIVIQLQHFDFISL